MNKTYKIEKIISEFVYSVDDGEHNIIDISKDIDDFFLHDDFDLNKLDERMNDDDLYKDYVHKASIVKQFRSSYEYNIEHVRNEYTIDGIKITANAIKAILEILQDARDCEREKREIREMKDYLDGRTLLEYFNDTVKPEFSLHSIHNDLEFSLVDISYWVETGGIIGEFEKFKDSKEVLGCGDNNYYFDIISALITFIEVLIAIKNSGNKVELAEFLSN